ncbi:MAG: tetratricopeptide repeat protein [Candidatus Riflebacteria bacterium]|nr:tetratricopeptide repeat protein [Candidatus Riflebacteria bacterium]
MSFSKLIRFSAVVLFVVFSVTLFAQPEFPPPGKGLKQGKMNIDPEEREKEKEKREKIGAMKNTAEAYKNLADLYVEQGKIDEAIANLKKILELSNSSDLKDDPKVLMHLGNVYITIAEIYISKDRFSDAEAIVKEGLEKIKDTNPGMASRMMLLLGNSYKKAGKAAEAENCYKKVIELNSQKSEKPGK